MGQSYYTRWSAVLLLRKILEDLCLCFFELRSRHAIARLTDSRCEGPQLSHVFLAMLAHHKMQPDSEFFQEAAGQVFIAGNKPDDLAAAIYRSPVFHPSSLQGTREADCGPGKHYTDVSAANRHFLTNFFHALQPPRGKERSGEPAGRLPGIPESFPALPGRNTSAAMTR